MNMSEVRSGFWSTLMASCVALAVAGCASTGTSRSTGEVVDDSALTAKVKTAIADEVGLEAATDVQVETYKGVVQLGGFVRSEAQRRAALAAANKVAGVRRVEDRLSLAVGEASLGEFVDDSAITAKVKTAIANRIGLGGAADVEVETHKGVVQLSGFLESDRQRELAVAAAAQVDGVKEVQNRISLK